MTLQDLQGLVGYCVHVGVYLGACPVLVTVFLGVIVRVFEDVALD